MVCQFFLLIYVRVCNTINVTILQGDVESTSSIAPVGRLRSREVKAIPHTTVCGKWATQLCELLVQHSPCGPTAKASWRRLARRTFLSQWCFLNLNMEGASLLSRPQHSTLCLMLCHSFPWPAWPWVWCCHKNMLAYIIYLISLDFSISLLYLFFSISSLPNTPLVNVPQHSWKWKYWLF